MKMADKALHLTAILPRLIAASERGPMESAQQSLFHGGVEAVCTVPVFAISQSRRLHITGSPAGKEVNSCNSLSVVHQSLS